MKVGDFFRTLDRDTVITELERQRPPYVEHHAGHIEAWNEIVKLTPIATEYTCRVGMRANADGKQYFDVSGVTAGSDERLSIAFVDWREWMSVKIVIDDDAAGATQEAICAAIVDEMTYHGYSNREVLGDGWTP